MGTASKIVSFAAFHEAKSFSDVEKNDGKMTPQNEPLKNGKAPETQGLQALCGEPSGKVIGKGKKKVSGKLKSTSSKKPKVTDTPGPKGYLHDCDTMSATALRLAFPLTYSSWRHRKHWCKTHPDYLWDPAWKNFQDFLRSEGPRPSEDHSLDRKDNTIKAYGPGLCRWATMTEQNNNKGDNIKVSVPGTNEVLDAKQLAKLHNVQVKTIHNWNSAGYSPLELLAGKKSAHLAAVSEALEQLPAPTPKLAPPARKIGVPLPPKPEDGWEPTPEDYEHYLETGQMRDSRFDEKLAEYKGVVAWIESYNAGLPVSPEPPQGKHYRFSNPANRTSQSTGSIPPQPSPKCKGVLSEDTGLPVEDDDDFDPADCYARDEDYEDVGDDE